MDLQAKKILYLFFKSFSFGNDLCRSDRCFTDDNQMVVSYLTKNVSGNLFTFYVVSCGMLPIMLAHVLSVWVTIIPYTTLRFVCFIGCLILGRIFLPFWGRTCYTYKCQHQNVHF